jgi:hypothetical protein
MAGNVTGFQRTFIFKANATYTEVGSNQAVVYASNAPEVSVPTADNGVPVGVVTYDVQKNDGGSIAVQLDRIAEVVADGNIAYGDALIVSAGGKVKKASSLAGGTKANILGEAQNSAVSGQLVQVLIRPRTATI